MIVTILPFGGKKTSTSTAMEELRTPKTKMPPKTSPEAAQQTDSAPKTKRAKVASAETADDDHPSGQEAKTESSQPISPSLGGTTIAPDKTTTIPLIAPKVEPDNKPGSKATAVKAKAKPVHEEVPNTAKTEPKTEILSKLESLDEDTVKRVLDVLNRRATSELNLECPEPKEAAQQQCPTATVPNKAQEPMNASTSQEPPAGMNDKTTKPDAATEKPKEIIANTEDPDMDEEAFRLKEQQVKMKKEAHARFMRFKRSLSSNLTEFQALFQLNWMCFLALHVLHSMGSCLMSIKIIEFQPTL